MASEKTEWLMSIGEGKKTVKWLGVDVNKHADPSSNWNKRVAKACGAFRSVGSLGNSNKGLSPRSWNLLLRGMIAPTLLWGSDVLCVDSTEKAMTQARKLQYAVLKKVLGGVHGSSGKQLAWIGGWDTVREIQHKRLGMITKALRGRSTLRELWTDQCVGAKEDSTGFLGWLLAESLRLTEKVTPAWEEVDVVQPNPRV